MTAPTLAAMFFLLAGTNGDSSAFEMGLRAYEDGDHQAAVVAFEASLTEQVDAATLYNYGNALARTDRWPEALAAFRSAQLRAPGDRDIRHNVELARRELGQGPPSSWVPPRVLGLAERISVPAAFLVLVAAAWLWALTAVLAGFRGGALLARSTWIGAGVVLVLAGFFTWRQIDAAIPRAVVISAASAQSDPSAAGAALFEVPAGTEVLVTENRPEWTRVRIHRRDVWLRAGSLQPLW